MRIKISADSTCDLPRELVEKYDIGITPLYIVMDGKAHRDGVDICVQDIFSHVAAGGEICGTSAVNVADYMQYWNEWLKDHEAVIHIGLSSGLSATVNNARLAAEELGNVWVVDSMNLSSGIGHLVLDAAILAESGMEPAAIQAELNARRERLDVSFILDTLAYLRKGGRCSALAALGANALGLKPCIEVRGGTMGVGRKYRGTLEKALLRYVEDRLKGRDDIDTRRIFITDSGMADSLRDKVQRAILACQPFAEVIRSNAGCTISNHCGPGCLGILYYHK
jgi:DegV family protein with EDD domain